MSQLNANSRLSLNLTVVVVCVGALVATGWRAANLLRDIKDEIGGLRSEVTKVSTDRWTLQDQERWASRLERLNRSSNLVIPEPAR